MNAEFDLPFPQYRCAVCEKDLPLGEARMMVTCADHTERPEAVFEIRRAEAADRTTIETICDRAMGETVLDVFGMTFDVLENINLIAVADGELLGILSLAIKGGEGTITFLSVYPEHQGLGVGTGLISAADRFAAQRGLPSLRVAVTNDDMPLFYLYQRLGFAIYEVAVGEAADRFGAATPGFSLIPVRDEIRLRRAVCTD